MGLPIKYDWPPTLKQIKEFADERLEALRKSAQPRIAFRGGPRASERNSWPEGHLANCYVPPKASQLKRLKEIYHSGEVPTCSAGATMRECVRFDENGGMHVPFSWLR